MKIDVKDLKKALQWIEENTHAEKVSLYMGDNKLTITTMDKYEAQVEIILYENSSMMPKIKKTDLL
jgi:hypothetical protein